jgi:biopolymer transport protein ExbD
MNLRPRRTAAPDINLAPLIDVVFLLLIFFMVATTFKDDVRIKVQLPQANGEETTVKAPHAVTITIDRDGRFYVNDRMVVDRTVATLKKAIAAEVGDEQDLQVIIKADAKTPHQAVMSAMDAASQLGLLRLAFAATRPHESQ